MVITIRYVFRTFASFYNSLCNIVFFVCIKRSFLDTCEGWENVSDYPVMSIDWDWCMFTIEVWKLYVKENLYGYNGTRILKHFVCKQTLNHSVKLAKLLSCVGSTYLYVAFDCVFLSCHISVLEWIYSLQLPECQEISCPKQARYLKFRQLQRGSNPQPVFV